MMPRIVAGLMGSSAANGSKHLVTSEQLSAFLNLALHHGVEEIDTARGYASGKSEELLGSTSARTRLVIATKAPAFSPGSLAHDRIIENCKKSLAALQVAKVGIYYLHGPDPTTPLAEQCRAINTLYREGKFEEFGICNLDSQAVQEIHDICTKNDFVLPTVYQGCYNALYRRDETALMPLLRRLGIRFYAWGPLAGSALVRPVDELLSPAEGSRFSLMPQYAAIFVKREVIDALRELSTHCSHECITNHEAALRWIRHHSALQDNDAIILGATSLPQLEQNLLYINKGPLSGHLAEAMDSLWTRIESSKNL